MPEKKSPFSLVQAIKKNLSLVNRGEMPTRAFSDGESWDLDQGFRITKQAGTDIAVRFPSEGKLMLRAAIIFFVIALVAMGLGMNNIAGLSAELGQLLLYVFLGLAVLSFLVSILTGRRSGPPLT